METERKPCQGGKDVQTNSRQQEGLSRFRDDKRKLDQEKVASSDKMSRARNVKDKEFQEIMESGGQAPFLWALPFLYSLPLLSKLPSPGLPGLFWYTNLADYGAPTSNLISLAFRGRSTSPQRIGGANRAVASTFRCAVRIVEQLPLNKTPLQLRKCRNV